MKAETQRGAMFERVVRVSEILRGLRFGRTVEEINQDVNDLTGHDWHPRTTLRDLQLLEVLGAVELVRDRWRWCFPGTFFDHSAEAVGRAADWHSQNVRSQHFFQRAHAAVS